MVFIDLYKQSQCLWNPQHSMFKDTTTKNGAWEDLSQAVGCDSLEARRKMKNLQGQFSREEKKLRQKRKSGAGNDAVSPWNYYKHMMFLKSKRKKGMEGDELELHDEIEYAVDNMGETGEVVQHDETEGSVAAIEPVAILREKILPKRQAAIKSKRLMDAINMDDDYDDIRDIGKFRGMVRSSSGTSGGVRRDNSDIFGELVAGKLKRLKTDHARNTVEHLISNVLWEASLGKYDHPNIITSPGTDIIIESITHS